MASKKKLKKKIKGLKHDMKVLNKEADVWSDAYHKSVTLCESFERDVVLWQQRYASVSADLRKIRTNEAITAINKQFDRTTSQ